MDLTDADVKLLRLVRKRNRTSKIASIVFLSFTMISAFGAVWFGARAAEYCPAERTAVAAEPRDPQADLQQAWLRLSTFQCHLMVVMTCTFLTVLYAVQWFSTLSQRRSDALILKLIGHVSGYPEM